MVVARRSESLVNLAARTGGPREPVRCMFDIGMQVGDALRRLWPLAHSGERVVLPDQASQLGERVVGTLTGCRIGRIGLVGTHGSKVAILCHTHTTTGSGVALVRGAILGRLPRRRPDPSGITSSPLAPRLRAA